MSKPAHRKTVPGESQISSDHESIINVVQRIYPRIRTLVLTGALICGIAGLLLAGKRLDDAIFQTLTMFVMNYGEEPANLLVNIARYLAALFTITALLEVFRAFLQYMQRLGRSITHPGDCTLVYGNGQDAQELLRKLGRYGIAADDNTFVFHAHRYILLSDEKSNFAWYERHKTDFGSHSVYVRTESLPGILSMNQESGRRIRCFSFEEIAARSFWYEHPLLLELPKQDLSRAHDYYIVILGMNRLTEELLRYGIQANIINEGQTVHYQVYGDDCSAYKSLHQNLDQLHIAVSDSPWYQHLDQLQSADMLLIAQQQQQTHILDSLFTLSGSWKNTSIYVFNSTDIQEKDLFLDHRCGPAICRQFVLIDWRSQANSIENITNEQFIHSGKMANLRYLIDNQGLQVEGGTDAAMEVAANAAWNKLDTFTRYSNIGLAYCRAIIERINNSGYHLDRCKIEHTRWCNYLLISNWRPSPPDTPKDTTARIHPLLQDYQALDASARQKNDRMATGG